MKKIFKVIKLTALMIILSLLLIGATSFLRHTFINSINFRHKNLTDPMLYKTENFYERKWHKNLTTINTSKNFFGEVKALELEPSPTTSARYLRLTADTPLLKTTNDTDTSIKNTLFLLPKSYFVKVLRVATLDSGAEGYYVRYNTYEGYAMKSAFSGAMSDNSTSQSGIQITMSEDAGTYLRESPEITSSNIKVLIPASTPSILLIGKIYGDTPSDGSTNLWYFVEYSTGPTTTYTGYLYSERCILSAPLGDLVLESDLPPKDTTPTQDERLETSLTQDQNQKAPTITASSAVMWVIALIFIIPIIAVFIMLVKRPKYKDDYSEFITNIDNPGDDQFKFDENFAPSISRSNGHKVIPKFKTQNLSDLARFVKLDTTLEASNDLTPTESDTPPLNMLPLSQESQSYLNTKANDHLKFTKNIPFTPKNIHKTPIEAEKYTKNYQKRPFIAENTPFTDTKTPLSNENIPFTDKDIPFTDENIPFTNKDIPFAGEKILKQTNSDAFPSLSDTFPSLSDAFPSLSDAFPSLSDEFSPNNATFTQTSDQSHPFTADYPPLSTKRAPKFREFLKGLMNRKNQKQKIQINRQRDIYRPSTLSSDDYFEFADSFELTTPINSHLVFSAKPQTKRNIRTGKRLNKR